MIVNKIKETYKLENSIYSYKIEDKEKNLKIFYDDNLKIINLTIENSKEEIIEKWSYKIDIDIINYDNYIENKSYVFSDNKFISNDYDIKKSEEKNNYFYICILQTIK